MDNLQLLVTAMIHSVYGRLSRLLPEQDPGERDRGSSSLEHVLWFVAAGVAVAVIGAIVWNQIKTEAQKPVQAPTAP